MFCPTFCLACSVSFCLAYSDRKHISIVVFIVVVVVLVLVLASRESEAGLRLDWIDVK